MDLLSLLFPKKSVNFLKFKDPFGYFSLLYPDNWKFNSNIAVVDRKYLISFSSPDHQSQLSIFVDLDPSRLENFSSYAKEELESSSAGIICTPVLSTFCGFPAYLRDYSYRSGATDFFGGGILFLAKITVFSLNWSAPSKKRIEIKPLLDKMINSFIVNG